jgi:hypothetical protein
MSGQTLDALRKPSPAFQAHVSGAEIAAHRGHDRSLRLHRFRQRPIDLSPVTATSPVSSSTANDGLRRPHSAAFKDGMPIGEDENVDPASIRR